MSSMLRPVLMLFVQSSPPSASFFFVDAADDHDGCYDDYIVK
jgi:hypothetical protein